MPLTVYMITLMTYEWFRFQSKRLGLAAVAARNESVALEDAADKQKRRIPELTDWLERLEELIKQIRDNFEKANKTLGEVAKPFPRFDEITSMLGRF